MFTVNLELIGMKGLIWVSIRENLKKWLLGLANFFNYILR